MIGWDPNGSALMTRTGDVASDAEALMRAHRYDEAIAGFQVRLADDPNDLTALLRMGLCHLLNRSEAVFLKIYHQVEAIIQQLGEVPERVGKLWFQYQKLVHSVTAAAAVAGGMAATTACHDDTTSSHKYSGGVYLGSAGVDGQDTITSSHRYSGGVYLDAGSRGGTGQGGQGGAGGAEPAESSDGGQGGASGAGQAGDAGHGPAESAQ
jgi:hypothetical protein